MACPRSLMVCLSCLVVGLAGLVLSPVASADAPLPLGGSGGSPIESPLVVPGAQMLLEGQGARDAEQARRYTPQAVLAREESQTKYDYLDAAEAARVVREAFPSVVDEAAGGAPRLPAGQRIARYVGPKAAQLDLPGGKHAVVESIEPIATKTSSGHLAPVDLGLTRVGGVFEPVRPVARVSIPGRLSAGVRVPGRGVSLTPVDERGSPLGGAGAVDGASVLYANTLTDADTLVKPTTRGFAVDAVLRSVDSPRKLYYRVGMPGGAKLVRDRRDGAVSVVDEGVTIAVVLPSSARDAAGTPVGVSTGVRGDTLVLEVGDAGEYQWPVEVDPEVLSIEDKDLTGAVFPVKGANGTNWVPFATHLENFNFKPWDSSGEQYWEITNKAGNAGEVVGVGYETKGQSTIYKFEATTYSENYNTNDGSALEIVSRENKVEEEEKLSANNDVFKESTICPEKQCQPKIPSTKNEENIARFLGSLGSGTVFKDEIKRADVYISQEKGPEVSFNKSSPTIDSGRVNVLYGSGAWLSPTQGAFEVKAEDPGIGVSRVNVSTHTGGTWNVPVPIYEEDKCEGVQCSKKFESSYSYSPSMEDGEDSIEMYAEDMMFLNLTFQTVKVDHTPPGNIKVSGWSQTREVSAAPHALTFEATDGTKPIPSSGVRSISVSVDGGQEALVPGASCSLGECTAKGEWTLHAEGLSEGVHRLVVTATDNAGNVSQPEEFTFDVRHASPVALGPGAVDPTTGQFSMGATDVSLGGTTGVSRVYQSRNLTAGVEGPLGPQWAVNLGSGEGLTVLPNGNVSLTASGGVITTFTLTEKGEYESPKGDGNLKLEAKEPQKGKGITEYLLTDPAGDTTTHFTQLSGAPPRYSNQFGVEAVGLKEPRSAAFDSSGNLWVTDTVNDRIEKFSPAGRLVAAYGSYGTEGGQFISPWGIAVNQSTGNVYVTDQGNYRVEEFSPSGVFVRAMGWGVSDGKAEYERCTSGCKAGILGSGGGQFSTLAGVTVDSSGNVWVVDFGNNRIQEFNAEGKYEKTVGSEGTGGLQFKEPISIVYSGGNLYVTEVSNDRVQELSTAGAFVRAMGWGVSDGNEKYEVCTSGCKAGIPGAGNGQLTEPRGIGADPVTGNLYVVDYGNRRVQELSSTGAFITKFGSSGNGAGQFAGPIGAAVSSTGAVYVVDKVGNRVEEWARSQWLPTLGEGPLASGSTEYAYQTVEVEGQIVVEPSEAQAPSPPGVSCGTKPEELKKGCRALTFKYAGSTTATGENQSQWGDYKGHLTSVYFHAWDPSQKAMTETAVAQYSYDNKGRLRAEWDPRISPALKTTYGYDTEGHLTAATRPGQETWALTYGTIAGDLNEGRLLKARQAPASTALWNGETIKNTEAPKLSGSPVVGVTMGVSNGIWSNNPVSYGYQWEDCNSGGGECTLIAGATNANYTVAASDVGHALVAQVSAVNGGGSVSVSSTASATVVPALTPTYTSSFGSAGSGNGQFSVPAGDAVDSKGNIWVTDYLNSRVQEFNEKSEYLKQFGVYGKNPSQFIDPEGIAIDSKGNVWVVDGGNNRVQVFNEKGEYLKTVGSGGSGNGQFKEPVGIAIDAKGNAWVVDAGNERIQEFNEKAEYQRQVGTEGTGNGQFKHPFCLAINQTTGYVYVTDRGNNRVEVFNEKAEYQRQFGVSGTGNGQFNNPGGIAIDTNGDAWVSDSENDRVEVFSENGTYVSQFGHEGSGNGQFKGPEGIALDSHTDPWVVDWGNSRVEKWTTPTETTGEHYSPGPGWSVEYHVPVAGIGAPYNLSVGEVAKWAEGTDPAAPGDVPVEGTAIFPPDEPQGWPASKYTRATIYYLDAEARAVNTVVPGGGISTAEYNEVNEVVRTLSADNRAAALKEAKPAEASEKLDTRSVYNEAGSELLETLGPEHKVKLASGTEVSARDHVKNYYNEGAPASGETYHLVTKTTNGALLANGEEKDVRTSTTSYGGQENLGWTLRKPTSATQDPGGLNLTTTTVYDRVTGNVVETRSVKGSGHEVPAPAFLSKFGSEGKGNGQFTRVFGVAVDAQGSVWAIDSGDSRVEKFSGEGKYLSSFGAKGSGVLQFQEPWGIAINESTGNVYIPDTGNNRVDELSSSGTFVRAWGFGVVDGKSELETCTTSCKAGTSGSGSGQLNLPLGAAIDGSGNVWVVDSGNNRVEEFTASGAFVKAVGSTGTGKGQFTEPNGIAFSDQSLYVSDYHDNRVEQFSEAGTYLGEFGSKGSDNGQFNGPYGIASDPSSGELYVADAANNRVQEFTPTGSFIAKFGVEGSGKGQFKSPVGVAVNGAGDIYVGDFGNARVDEWEPVPAAPVYAAQFGTAGLETEKQLKEPKGVAIAANGNVYALDTNNNSVEEFSPSGTYQGKFGSGGKEHGQFKSPYGIAVDAKGNVWVADTANNRVQEFNEKHEWQLAFGSEGTGASQFKEPKAIAVAPNGNVYVSDAANNRVQEFSEKGVFVAAFGFGVKDEKAEFEICTTGCKAGIAGSGNGQFSAPRGIAVGANDTVWVADNSNNRVEEFNEKSEYVTQFGSKGTGNGQFKEPKGIAVDASGNVWVADSVNNRVQEFTPSTTTFLTAFADKGTGNGQFEEPWGIAFAANGTAYIADAKNNRVEQWTPASRPGNEGAHDIRTVYYTAEAEAEVAGCRSHPEWAGLPCQTEPAAQPGVSGSPELPVSTFSYNVWDEIEAITEKFGSTTRIKTQTYDPAGRALTSETTSTIDTALPKVTNEYSTETGALIKQSTTVAGKTKAITSKFNNLGQLVEYTDAEGAVTKYTYDIDGRPEEVSYELPGKNTDSQIYAYDPTTGFMTKLLDTGPGASMTFTATYDVEGKMLTESYPNGMNATYTSNPAGQVTGLEYVKTTHCSKECTWFSDALTPSIHGETLAQTSSLSKESYAYDNAGRLTETQETPTGKGCTARLYGYDEESNRTSLTTRESSTETCATEGGLVEAHSYDSADRLIDAGVTYEAFGNTTKMPAQDAGGHELTSEYYVDSQVAVQKQNEETIKYFYDPLGRTLETVSEGKTAAKVVSHYAGPGGALTWTSEGSEQWTRNIPGVDGTLTATQASGSSPVLQLHDLQGNTVATAALSETETKLLSIYNSTEFGVPQPGTTPPEYAWLGATGVATEIALSSGITTQSGASYVPQVARSLQTFAVIPPGAFPNGSSSGTQYTATLSAASLASAEAQGAKIVQEIRAAEQKAHEEEIAEQERVCRENGGCGAEDVAQGESEEGEGVIASWSFDYEGRGAHAADVITCAVAEGRGLPHASSHSPGLVNWVIVVKCTAPVFDLRIRLALVWEEETVSGTGYVPKGNTSYAQQTVQSSCITGWYTGWVHVDLKPPPGYYGLTTFSSWSKASRYVKC
jgi:YD repeat-containing protein